MKFIYFIGFIFFTAFVIFAQDNSWKITGQVQLRSELDARDFNNKSNPVGFVSSRIRLGVEKTLLEKVNVFVQFQDSRVFGQEGNATTSISNIDLHQGYFILNNLFEVPVYIQAGRFEMKYGMERFFGPSNWSYIGRAFDGLRIGYKGNISFDLFGITTKETTPYIAGGSPNNYPFEGIRTENYYLYGGWFNTAVMKASSLDFITYYEIDQKKSDNVNFDLKRFTSALTYFGNYDLFSTILEAGYQYGKVSTANVSAYLISLQLYYTINNIKPGIGADIYSGTKTGDTKYKTFDPRFGTGHKFLGSMDYFTNIPAHTRGAGINDFYVSAEWQKNDSPWYASVYLHHFMYNQKTAQDKSALGQELDLTLRYQFIKGTFLTLGGSVFFPGDVMKAYFETASGKRDDPAFWTYLMAVINI